MKHSRLENDLRFDPTRTIRAPRGSTLTCKNWLIEAAYRMIQNNLDPDVAEDPHRLVVYGGSGRAARNWPCYDAILESLVALGEDESLLIQSGKAVGVFKTHTDAPRVLIANSNLVPYWATSEKFSELDRAGLMMYGQMTAGSWIYIGSQGIVQGTYETFVEAGRQHTAAISPANGFSPRVSAAWAVHSRSRQCWRALQRWSSSARNHVLIFDCAHATSTTKRRRWTRHSR